MDYESNTTIDNLAALVSSNSIDIVIHSGDISYADGYEPHWDTFFNRIQKIAAYVPYMASPGNHEFWYNFTSYKHRFYLPSELLLSGSGSGNLDYMVCVILIHGFNDVDEKIVYVLFPFPFESYDRSLNYSCCMFIQNDVFIRLLLFTLTYGMCVMELCVGDGMYYSWEAGFSHFISLNSETAIDTANFSDEMLNWLQKDLEQVILVNR